jgi:hypothetical protein
MDDAVEQTRINSLREAERKAHSLFDDIVFLDFGPIFAGWGHPGEHAGHLVGEFPHVRISGDKMESYIAAANGNPMRRTAPAGRDCRWILEVRLIDRQRGFGGFFEQLLEIPSARTESTT